MNVLIILILFFVFIHELYEKNERFKTLKNVPNIKISGSFYINMAKSTERNASFLSRFNGPLPLERIEGVEINYDPKYLKRGTYGCALAHANAMKIISQKPPGWYLVCEDDCYGDFSAVESNLVIRNIVFNTKKQFINLSKPNVPSNQFNSVCSNLRRTFEKTGSSHSLNHVCWSLTAYLITQSQAAKSFSFIMNSIDTPNAEAVDSILAKQFRKPRLFQPSGDNSGCNVSMFEDGYIFGVPSIIESLGR